MIRATGTPSASHPGPRRRGSGDTSSTGAAPFIPVNLKVSLRRIRTTQYAAPRRSGARVTSKSQNRAAVARCTNRRRCNRGHQSSSTNWIAIGNENGSRLARPRPGRGEQRGRAWDSNAPASPRSIDRDVRDHGSRPSACGVGRSGNRIEEGCGGFGAAYPLRHQAGSTSTRSSTPPDHRRRPGSCS